MKSALHSDFLPQTLLPAALVLGSWEQAGHYAQALRSVAAASGQAFLGSRGWRGGEKKGELGAQKLPGCPFPALGAAVALTVCHVSRPGQVKGLLALPPLTKTPLPNGAWEPSVTVYTHLKIPTEKGSAQGTPWPPETSVLPEDPAGVSGEGGRGGRQSNRHVPYAFTLFELGFWEPPCATSPLLGGPEWTGGEKGPSDSSGL